MSKFQAWLQNTATGIHIEKEFGQTHLATNTLLEITEDSKMAHPIASLIIKIGIKMRGINYLTREHSVTYTN